MHDGKPVPKVIDFGVAKAIEQRLTEKTLFTAVRGAGRHARVHEPRAGRDERASDVDTRSDVYSLGVLLYELLTGTTPLERQRLRTAAFGEMRAAHPRGGAAAAEHAAQHARAALATVAAAARRPSRRSCSGAGPRRPRLDRDAVRWRRTAPAGTRRPTAWRRDVERYLKDEPVEACPPTLGYRLRKAYRRNKVAFGTGGAVGRSTCRRDHSGFLASGPRRDAERDTAAEQAQDCDSP